MLVPANLCRVLRYLPSNLCRPEIACELSVSLKTVNTYIRNVCTKFEARDRTSTVQLAPALRLLSAGLPR